MLPTRERGLRAGFVACLVVVAAYLVISAFEPFRTNWGDPWSDGNAMTAGRYFATEGFIETAFTPILDVGPIDADSLRYTHYPPLPDLVAGAVQTLIGPDHLTVHRLLALVWSAIALLLFHRYISALLGRAVASLSVVLIATNLLFLQYADTVHHIPLYMMTGFGTLVAALRWLDDRSRRALAAVGALAFLCFLASYDYYFFLSIAMLATVRLRGARIFRGHGFRLILVYGIACVASIVVKNLLVIWAEGFDHWYQDIVFQFFERATSAHARAYKEGLRDVVFWRIWRFYSPLFFVALCVQLVGLIDWVRGMKPAVSLRPLMLLVAAVPFLLVFTQLVAEQYHPMMLLLPFAGVGIATLIHTVWQRSRALAGGLLALYLGWQGWQLHLFPKTFLVEEDVAAVRKVLEGNRHRFVMSNILVDGPVRYLWSRHLFGIATQPTQLHDQLDIHGDHSPLVIVQLKRMGRHMYDKGVYPYFAGERRWSWITRPDYYRNVVARRFKDMDATFDRELDGLGTVAYESPGMRVRTISEADIERAQLAKLPATTPDVIDFETASSELFKLRGVGGRQSGSAERPGYAGLYSRQPAKLVFTLQGYKWLPNGRPIGTSALQFHLAADRDVRMAIDLSTSMFTQAATIRINGHQVAVSRPMTQGAPIQRIEFDVPRHLLRAGAPQILEIDALNPYSPSGELLRLHRFELSRR